jgi:hypothetical protein
MVAVVQTFGDQLNLHPHLHALVTRGGWTASGEWIGVPYVDQGAAELLFRHKVIRLLVGAGLLDEDRVRVLLSWRHTGFSVHNQVNVAPGDGRVVETLARYCLRTPVSLTRLSLRAGESTVEYRVGGGHDVAPGETLDVLEFLARVLSHIPDPKRHLVHYYGAYSNVVRGRQKARASLALAPATAPVPPHPTNPDPPQASPQLATLRRRWASLICRVYEVDPLLCPCCRSLMRVVSFITQPRLIRRILDHLARRDQSRAPPPHSPPAVAPT